MHIAQQTARLTNLNGTKGLSRISDSGWATASDVDDVSAPISLEASPITIDDDEEGEEGP